MAQDENKKQECKQVPVKPSLSEIFLEATNQLKGTDMTPDDIRNYTLRRYNVDVIKCMKDINLLTRFSEIKLPNIASRKYSKKYSKERPVNTKSLKRVSAKRSRRRMLTKRKTSESKRKVVGTKSLHRRTTAVGTANSKKSSSRRNPSEDDPLKSRISLIRLIRSRSPIKNELYSNQIYSSGDSNSLARPQAPHPANGKALGDMSTKNISNASTKFEATKTDTTDLEDSTEPSRDKNGTSQDDGINGFRDCPEKQNGNKDKRNSLRSESKIVKAGYAVKNFIEELGTKYASGLMFSNQHSSDKSIRNDDEKMEGPPVYVTLPTVKKDLVKDNTKIGTEWTPGDNKPTTVLASNYDQRCKMTPDFKCDCIQGDRGQSVVEMNRDVQDVQIAELVGDHAETGPHYTKLMNEKARDPVETSTDDMLAVRKWENSRQSPGYDDISEGEKVHRSVLRPKGVTAKDVRPIKVRKPTRFAPDSRNGNKTANKSSATRISRNRSRKELKENLHSFKNGKKTIKTIPKKKRRTICDTTTGFGNSTITKKTTKRTKPRVTFADACGEKRSSATSQAKIHVPKKYKNEKNNRMENLEELLEKRKLRKRVK